MTTLNPIYGSPFIQKSAGSDLFDMMVALKRKHPRAKPQKIQELWVQEVLDDPKQTEFAVRAHSINIWTQVDRLDVDRPRRQYVKREAEKKDLEKRVKAAVEKTKSIWLANVMSSTFGELAKIGGKFAKLSKLGKPNQRVSDVMSEDAVQKILK